MCVRGVRSLRPEIRALFLDSKENKIDEASAMFAARTTTSLADGSCYKSKSFQSSGRRLIMTTGTDISALYHEFTDALTEILAENAVGPTRRGRLARARAAVKKHPEYSEHAYFLAVETAFKNWEGMQNVGR
jgi:hypothetical protein